MLTGQQRSKLEDEYRREPRSVIGVLLGCVVGLLTVVVLALVGMDVHTYAGDETSRQVVTQAP